jgi:hypothetical protein
MPENPLEVMGGTISDVHYQIVKDLEDIKLSMVKAVSRGM